MTLVTGVEIYLSVQEPGPATHVKLSAQGNETETVLKQF